MTTKTQGTLSQRHRRILIAMHRLSGGSARPCRYEDIVVTAFALFPEEFQVRGHPQFPDSSDIHKPLYGPLKRFGLVKAANKTFSLTPSGLDLASRLIAHKAYGSITADSQRMNRDHDREIKRLLKSVALKLFAEGSGERILDTDFYSYLGATVRTPPNDFIGRLATVAAAIEAAHPEPPFSHYSLR